MSILTSERRRQLAKANAALDRGDHVRAAAHFFEDIEGFVARIAAVLEKAEPLTPKRAKADHAPRAKSTGVHLKQIQTRQAIVALLTENPKATTGQIMRHAKCSDNLARAVRREMGITSPALLVQRDLRAEFDALAPDDQITSSEVARQLGCAISTVCQIRSEKKARETSNG